MPEKPAYTAGTHEGWGPWPVVTTTFRALLRKLLKAQGEKATRDQLLAIVDYWIGELFRVRSVIESGQFPGVYEKPKGGKPPAKPRARTR